MLLYGIAYWARPYITDAGNRNFFFPALTARVVGALALGFIYQFYYSGGDTFNFHTHGSRIIWNAFIESPETGLKLLFADGSDETGIYKYSSQIPFFRDKSSYTIIRIAGFFDLFTFSSYAGTALLFAGFSFIGSWMWFLTFYKKYPGNRRWIALAVLFFPSVIFWGSGIMKDSVVFFMYRNNNFEIDRLFNRRKLSFFHFIVLLAGFYLIFLTKKFVLQALVPSAILWVYLTNLNSIKSFALRIVVFPLFIIAIAVIAFFSVQKIGEGDQRYSLDNLAYTSKVTATDILYQTGRDAGSGYTLGQLDGSFTTMLALAPKAINVSLFRPYIWEVKNPLMLLSSLEGILMFLVSCYVIINVRFSIFRYLANPDIAFSLLFALIFAFAVGVSTYNFGTLSRYKIPVIPFFVISMSLILYLKKSRKFSELDTTE